MMGGKKSVASLTLALAALNLARNGGFVPKLAVKELPSGNSTHARHRRGECVENCFYCGDKKK